MSLCRGLGEMSIHSGFSFLISWCHHGHIDAAPVQAHLKKEIFASCWFCPLQVDTGGSDHADRTSQCWPVQKGGSLRQVKVWLPRMKCFCSSSREWPEFSTIFCHLLQKSAKWMKNAQTVQFWLYKGICLLQAHRYDSPQFKTVENQD